TGLGASESQVRAAGRGAGRGQKLGLSGKVWHAHNARHYLAPLTIAMPQGPSPTLMRRNSLRDFTSTTETSFDAPFAVYSFDPVGSSAIPQARFPTGIIVATSFLSVSITATVFPRPVET